MSYAAAPAPALPRLRVTRRRPGIRSAVALAALAGALALPALRAEAPHAPAPRVAAAGAGATSTDLALLAHLPLAARLSIARTVAADLPAYALRATPAGAAGASPAQRLTESFSRSGVTVRAGAHQLRLTLGSLAGGGTRVALPAAAPVARANRVSYARGPVTELYDNTALGLEQSFRIAAAPAPGARTLTLGLALGGTLSARAAGGDGLALRDARGATVLRYRGLVAHDARGRALPARMTRTRAGVALHVATASDTRYPVTVDPVVQQARLTASDGVVGQHVGETVAISGDTIVLGNQNAAIAGNLQGAVYVFTKPAGGWSNGTQVSKLYASDPAPGGNSTSNVYGDTLGATVAISGDTIVAGAPRATVGTGGSAQGYAGKVYVFVKPSGGWAPSSFQTAELAASDATTYDYFGSAVAIDGDTVVSGSPSAGSSNFGAAYVYTKPAGGWVSATQNARLSTTDGATDRLLGAAVAVSGAWIAVGAPASPTSDPGSVYVYKKPDAGWTSTTQTAKLTSAAPIANETLGVSVALDGTTLVAGAPNNRNPGTATPSVYVFDQPAGGWVGAATSTARLTQPDNSNADHFGGAVAISGATIAAASAYTAGPSSGTAGATYVFARGGATWTSSNAPIGKVNGSDGNVEQADAIGISGTTLVSSAKYAKVGSTNQQGAAYVFDTAGAGPGTGGGGGDGGGGTGGGGTGGGGTGGGDTTTPAPVPIPAPAQAPSTAVTNFVPAPTRVANDIGWGDVAANLLGITPGSGATSNWGEFVFIAVCHQPDGCNGTITFGAQKPVTGAPRAVASAAAAKPKKAPAPYGKASFSLKSGQKRTLTVKLSSAARKLGKKKKSLTGYVTVTIKRPGAAAEVLTHKLTLKVAKKAKAKKK